eukprot:Sspe_Gene.10447::Locus_3492_Transcript_1_1_Confidence_1.000_Length_3412::g.10447::m.10447
MPEAGGHSIDTVLRRVADRPGTSSGVSYDALKCVWSTMCQYLEGQLLAKRGIAIPHFATVTLRTVATGTPLWGDRTQLIPTFTLLAQFTQQFGIDSSLARQPAAHHCRIPTIILNTCLLATMTGLPKDIIVNSIKDAVRKIGELASSGSRMTIDFGFCKLLFDQRRYAVHWNLLFLEKVQSLFSNVAHRQLQMATRTPTLAGHAGVYAAGSTDVSDLTVDATKVQVLRDMLRMKHSQPHHKAKPPSEPATSPLRIERSSTPQVPQVPRYPTTARAVTPSQTNLVARTHTLEHSAPRPRPPSRTPIRDPPAEQERPLSARLPRDLSDRTPTPTPPSLTPRPPSATASVPEEAHLADFSRLGEYQRRKHMKLWFRRSRNKAFKDAWDAQMKLKTDKKEEEALSEQKKVEILKQWVQEEEVREKAECRETRKHALKMQELNLRLAEERQKEKHTKAVEGKWQGDIFTARVDLRPVPPDLDFLKKQIDEKERKKKEEREAEKKYSSEVNEQLSQAWKEMDQREREAQRAHQQKVREDYEKYLQQTAGVQGSFARKRAAASCEPSGDFFFNATSPDELVDQEIEDQRRARTRAKLVQEANASIVRERNELRKKALKDRKREGHRLQKRVAKQEQRSSRKDHERKVKEQKELKDIWEKQISDKAKAKEEERRISRGWVDRLLWSNESSDEEKFIEMARSSVSPRTTSVNTPQGH